MLAGCKTLVDESVQLPVAVLEIASRLDHAREGEKGKKGVDVRTAGRVFVRLYLAPVADFGVDARQLKERRGGSARKAGPLRTVHSVALTESVHCIRARHRTRRDFA